MKKNSIFKAISATAMFVGVNAASADADTAQVLKGTQVSSNSTELLQNQNVSAIDSESIAVKTQNADAVNPAQVDAALKQLLIDPSTVDISDESPISDQATIDALNANLPDWAKADISNNIKITSVTVHFNNEDGAWDHDAIEYFEEMDDGSFYNPDPPSAATSESPSTSQAPEVPEAPKAMPAPVFNVIGNVSYGFTASGTGSTAGDAIEIVDTLGNSLAKTTINSDLTWSTKFTPTVFGTINAKETDATGKVSPLATNYVSDTTNSYQPMNNDGVKIGDLIYVDPKDLDDKGQVVPKTITVNNLTWNPTTGTSKITPIGQNVFYVKGASVPTA
jgi:hypothetical protein